MRRALLAALVGLPFVVTVTAGSGSNSVLAVPPGFVDETIANVSSPTAVEALPDGRVIVLEQDGAVKRIDARSGAAQVRTMAQFDVCSNSERGLLGFAVGADYFTEGFVYVYRTITSSLPGGCHNRVSRFFMNEAGLDVSSEVILIENISSVAGNHNGGDLEIGNDGLLYIAIGDAGRDPRGSAVNDAAQDLSLLNGKILRVDPMTGAAAPGNPYNGAGTDDCRARGNVPSTPTTTCREIFASGLRNPYRFAFDPNTAATRFFINDVGQNTREEVNDGILGANYGWPGREGQCPQGDNPPCPGPPSGVTDPITDYDHDLGQFITAGAFIPNGVWPAEYDGGYLFADGASGDVWLRRADGTVDYGTPMFDTTRPTDMAFVTEPVGPTLWYVQQNGQVHRVSYTTAPGAADSGPLRYDPLPTMERRFDTRTETPAAPIRAGRTRMVGIGAPTGATAALVNITLVRPSSGGAFATVWEPRTRRPSTANVNAPGGAAVGNSSIVPLDANGNLLLFAQVTTAVVIDVAGFYFPSPSAVSGGRFAARSPSRLVDTRNAPSPTNDYTRVSGGTGEVVSVPVVGKIGLPDDATAIGAVVLVIAGINTPTSPIDGFATAYPTGTTRPLASSVNVTSGADARANLAVVPVSSAGTIDVFLRDIAHFTIDVAGYVTSDTAPAATAGRFHLIAPTREADSRVGLGFGPLADQSTATLNAAAVPDGATAIAQNLTLAPSGGRGFVTAYPGGVRPLVSSINASGPGQVRGALGFTALSAGAETFFSETPGQPSPNQLPNQLVVDVFGWFE